MIKTLFLLGVVFVLTYDPQANGLVQQQQAAHEPPRAKTQAQVATAAQAPPNYGYANKHQHYESVQFGLGQEGYQYRTNMPGAALY